MKESNKIYHNEYDKIGPVEELTTLGRQTRAGAGSKTQEASAPRGKAYASVDVKLFT